MPRTDLHQIIGNVFPDGQVTADILYDGDSYYQGIGEEVRAALLGIDKALHVLHRPPVEEVEWDETSDPDGEDLWPEDPRTYDILFLGPPGETFEFETTFEEEELSEEEKDFVLVSVPATGRMGFVVGISLIAPFAVVQRGTLYRSESGFSTPDIYYGQSAENVDADSSPDEESALMALECTEGLDALHGKIAAVLASFGIQVLNRAELDEPVPGLAPDPEMNRFTKAEFATVGDALFFTILD